VLILELEFTLTVQDALKRPVFAQAQVAAGAAGLDRPVRWVHILELSHFDELLYGEEMILATGVGFRLDPAASVAFMEKLISQRASCLCMEIGPYFQSVPAELTELADRWNFPLILFPHTVRFVDITQDLHTLILSRHHDTLRELEVLSREFHRLTLTSQGTGNVLKLLHRSTRMRLLYLPLAGNPVFHPAPAPAEQERLLRFLEECRLELDGDKPNAAPFVRPYEDRTAIVKPIGAQNQTWAYLAMFCERQPREYDYLLLDSASLSIAQELLRTRYMEERRLFSENLWVDELLGGKLEEDEHLLALASPHLGRIRDVYYRVCLIEVGHGFDGEDEVDGNDRDSVRYHLSLIIRSVFEKHGYRPYITVKNDRLAVIAMDMKAKVKAKERLQLALDTLTTAGPDSKVPKGLRLAVGCGNAYSHLRDACASHREAFQALSIRNLFAKPCVFYEELGVYRLLLQLNDGATLQQFVRDALGPLLDHDQAKGSELLATLQVYLDHDGSKQIAAQKLYIVRQSLYYRLEKIKELLGVDVLSPEHRISIQVALLAYRMLQPELYRELPRQTPPKRATPAQTATPSPTAAPTTSGPADGYTSNA
jgi:PucR family transcriptional regulator, purine catabolism regulatory protein